MKQWKLYALSLLVLVSIFSLAQADPPNTPKEVMEMKEKLFRENYAKAKTELINYYKERNPKLAEIFKNKKLTNDFVRKHVNSEIKEVILDLLKPEINSGKVKAKTFEKVPFKAYTAFDRGASFSEIPKTDLPTTRNAFEPKVREGYSSEIKKLDPNAPHTFGNTNAYIEDRFTRSALEQIRKSGAKVEIHAGGNAETFQSLKNRGYEISGEIRSSLSRYERVYMARHPKTGEVRYAITGLSGADRVFHMESMLKLAKVKGSQVSVVGDPEKIKSRNYNELLKGFRSSAVDGDKALIGFRNEMRKELTERALYSRRHQVLRETLGENPKEGLIERLKAEKNAASDPKVKESLAKVIKEVSSKTTYDKILRMESNEIFKKGFNADKMKRFESYMKKLAKKHKNIKTFGEIMTEKGEFKLPAGVNPKKIEAGRNISNNVLNMDEYIIRTRSGRTESLKVVANYYGDTMGTVGRALVDGGVKKIGYFGTAGGISTSNNPVKVGDIHVPKNIYSPNGELANGEVKNAFLEKLKTDRVDSSIRDRIKMGTELGNVRSPMVETESWLKNVKKRGLSSVEVETSYLSRGVHESAKRNGVKPKLYSSVIISDVPGSGETLAHLNPSKRKHTFSRMLDNYLEVMEVENIQFREKALRADRIHPSYVDGPTEKAYKVAEALMPRKVKGNVLMREHIARTLIDRLGTTGINNLEYSEKMTIEKLKIPEDVKAELTRRIKNPYSDKKLFSNIEKGNARLSYLAKALNNNAAGRNYDLKLLGEMARGTWSGGEIAFTVEGADAKFKEYIKNEIAKINKNGKGPKLKFVESPGANIESISLKKGRSFLTEPNRLKRLYSDVNYKRGSVMLYNDWAGRPVAEYDNMRRKKGRRANMVEALSEAGLYANYEAAANSPEVKVKSEKFKRFEAKLKKYGATIEFIDPATHPKWEPGATGKTVIENGKIKVLLPKGKTVKSLALMEELTHVIDFKKKMNKYGSEYMEGVFKRAKTGDKQARAMLYDMEIRAKKIALLNMESNHPLRKSVKTELEALTKSRDKMYNRKLDFKKLIEAEDYYSLGRKMEDIVRERKIMKKADPELKRYIENTIKILKYGDPTPEHKKVTLIRGVKNDKIWKTKEGRHFMLSNRMNHGRTGWDSRLGGGMERYFKEATSRSWEHGRAHTNPKAKKTKVYDFEALMYDHAASTTNSKKSMFISSSGTAKSAWGPPFYVIRTSPERAMFNYKSRFPGEAEVLLPFFVLPNEVHRKYESYHEAINDPKVKKSPYYKLASRGSGSIKENWKKIHENIKNGRPPTEGIAGLNSSFRTYNVGPNASNKELKRFKRNVLKYRGEIEWVSSKDARLAKDGQARTYVTNDGRLKVLLPNDKPIKRFALVDETTHLRQIDKMRNAYGRQTVAEIFKAAATGDPMAERLLLQWEIKAKENVLKSMKKNDPNRKLVEKSLKELKRKMDPLHKFRRGNGRLNWKKVRTGLKSIGGGVAHFTLSLFLMELARAVQTKDKFIIEEFFDGLMITDFYVSYGAFSAGAMGGQYLYTKFLQRYIKPKFVNTIMKSTFVMAAGMAISEIAMGHFEGKAFAINLSGLALSSTAVKTGMAGIKWAVPMSKIAGKAPWMSKLLKAYKASRWAKIGGWVFTAAETAVVLYYGDKIARGITNYLEKKEARNAVGDASEELLEAVKSGDKEKVKKAVENLGGNYEGYRNYLYKPMKEDEMLLMTRLNKLGRELKGVQDSYDRYMELYNKDPDKYKHLKRIADNLKNGKMKDIEADMKEAFAIYERSKDKHLKEIYEGNIRGRPLVNNDMETIDALRGRTSGGWTDVFERGENWWTARSIKRSLNDPSDNRLETYVDEADVLNLALAMTSRSDVRSVLKRRMDEIKIMAETDRVLYEASSGAKLSRSSGSGNTVTGRDSGSVMADGESDTEGMMKRLHGMGNK